MVLAGLGRVSLSLIAWRAFSTFLKMEKCHCKYKLYTKYVITQILARYMQWPLCDSFVIFPKTTLFIELHYIAKTGVHCRMTHEYINISTTRKKRLWIGLSVLGCFTIAGTHKKTIKLMDSLSFLISCSLFHEVSHVCESTNKY